MAFIRPTLAALIDQVIADIQSRIPGTDATLRRSNLNVLSRVLAAGLHGLYGYIQWLAAQLIYDTAEGVYLERWASIWKINRIPASFAVGTLSVTGLSGVTLPALTELQRADGALFTVDADVTLVNGAAVVAVTALDAGQLGNTAIGTGLKLSNPVANINSSAVANLLSGGSDAETDEALRARLIARIQKPPHGGAKHDYEAWALECAGVTRAWVAPQELGAGTVSVRFVRDNDSNLVPDLNEVAIVQAYLDDKRPVTAKVTVLAPIPVALNFVISLITPNTLAVRDAVMAELADLIQREAAPGKVLYLSHIRAAISAAAGEDNYVMSSPSADVAYGVGEIAVMGVVTWL